MSQTTAKLLSMATKIRVAESTMFLARNKGVFSRIATPRGYAPERFLPPSASVLGDHNPGGHGNALLHVQPGRRNRGMAS